MTAFFVIVALITLLTGIILYKFKNKKFDGYKSAVELLEQGYNIFVTGGAGTGKSYILKKLKKHYKAKLAITSTTGVSALNINGQTIHSWAGIGIANISVEKTVEKIKGKNALYSQILCAKMLAIDEISMLDNKTLDYVNNTLKLVRNNKKPFGGIQVLFFGDFFQLPPVKLGENGRDFCFNSKTWQELDLKPILLKEIKRQSEEEFIKALNNIRVGFVTPENTQMFKKREEESKEISSSGILHIFGTNEEADAYNLKCFNELDTSSCTYIANDTFYKYDKYENPTQIEITENSYNAMNNYDKNMINTFNENCKAPSKLDLKLNTRVMLIKNLDVKGGLVNGSCGSVVELNPNSIVVLFDDGNRHVIEKTEFLYQKDALPKIKRLQYPLRLAYGITIHKSQGMTFDNLVVNFERVFSDGQGYVALSRTKTLQGLIINKYAPGKVSANQEVVEFYRQLEKYGKYKQKRIIIDHKSVENVTHTNQEKVEKNKDFPVESDNTTLSNSEVVENSDMNNNININLIQNSKEKEKEKDLLEILKSNKSIIIEYVSYKNGEEEITTRRIKPISIHKGSELNQKEQLDNGSWDNDAIYLKAYCFLRDEERTFRLDRIKSISL